jgi:Cellulose binding domain
MCGSAPTAGGTTAGASTGGTGSNGGTGSQGCAASFSVTSAWQGGYQGAVTVTDTGGGPVTSWSVTLAPSGGGQVTQAWNGTLTTASNGTATVHNASWNGALAAGASTDFGFLASLPAGAGSPAATLNCSTPAA